MMSPDEVVGACVGELYRYRLAVKEQLPRIDAATRAVRTQRDRIEKDIEELIVAPSMPIEAFKEEVENINSSDVPMLWRLKTEAQFLLSAVYGILTMSKAIRAVTAGEMNACVQHALGDFEKAAPDADLLRHLHEHMDAYLRGKGKHAHRLPDPTEAGAVAMLEEGLVYFVGGRFFELSAIAQAAEVLARDVAACTM